MKKYLIEVSRIENVKDPVVYVADPKKKIFDGGWTTRRLDQIKFWKTAKWAHRWLTERSGPNIEKCVVREATADEMKHY